MENEGGLISNIQKVIKRAFLVTKPNKDSHRRSVHSYDTKSVIKRDELISNGFEARKRASLIKLVYSNKGTRPLHVLAVLYISKWFGMMDALIVGELTSMSQCM